MLDRRYRVRKTIVGKKKQTTYRITVPPELARLIPEDQEFVVVLDEDGLHYRPAPEEEPPEPPSWARR